MYGENLIEVEEELVPVGIRGRVTRVNQFTPCTDSLIVRYAAVYDSLLTSGEEDERELDGGVWRGVTLRLTGFSVPLDELLEGDLLQRANDSRTKQS